MSVNYKLTLVPFTYKGRNNDYWTIDLRIGCEWVPVEDQEFFAKREARAYAEKLMEKIV